MPEKPADLHPAVRFPSGAGPRYARAAFEMLLDGGSARVEVRTDSMRPVLAPGDRVVVVPCTLAELALGDIVVIERPGAFIVHRFLYRRGARSLVCKGDRIRRADEPVGARFLVGRVTARERNGTLTPAGDLRARLRGAFSLAEFTLARLKDFFLS